MEYVACQSVHNNNRDFLVALNRPERLSNHTLKVAELAFFFFFSIAARVEKKSGAARVVGLDTDVGGNTSAAQDMWRVFICCFVREVVTVDTAMV